MGEPETVLSFVDRFHSDYGNCYNVLIRFEEGGVGILTGNRAAGDRYERLAIHGKGISAYLRLADTAEILGGEDGGEAPVEPSQVKNTRPSHPCASGKTSRRRRHTSGSSIARQRAEPLQWQCSWCGDSEQRLDDCLQNICAQSTPNPLKIAFGDGLSANLEMSDGVLVLGKDGSGT